LGEPIERYLFNLIAPPSSAYLQEAPAAMPAIQPVRLKNQVAHLAEQFTHPGEFVRSFSELLEAYADRTHRSGQAGEPQPLLPSFNTPAPVTRQIWLEILPLITSQPQAALELCDTLWLQSSLEHRLLVTGILGQLPVEYQKEVIDRVHTWTKVGIEDHLVDALLDQSLTRLRSQSPRAIAETAESWLSSPNLHEKQLGLRLLAFMASDVSYVDLPVIFRLLTPYLRIAPRQLRPDIISIIDHLISRSAEEVAYLLHQNLTASDNPDTGWLIRQVIAQFPSGLESGLREAVKHR
jgi:hypothetical protein